MKDDHEDHHKELAINLQTVIAKARVHRPYLPAAISCQWLCPKFAAYVGIVDKEIYQKLRARPVFAADMNASRLT